MSAQSERQPAMLNVTPQYTPRFITARGARVAPLMRGRRDDCYDERHSDEAADDAITPMIMSG